MDKPTFTAGDELYQKCPAVSSSEGVIGYTKIAVKVVGQPLEYDSTWWIPVVNPSWGSRPHLVSASSIYKEEAREGVSGTGE